MLIQHHQDELVQDDEYSHHNKILQVLLDLIHLRNTLTFRKGTRLYLHLLLVTLSQGTPLPRLH